jgi:hypothetical protein
MRRTVLIGIVAMTFACGGSDRSSHAGASSAGGAASTVPPGSGAPAANEKVTLVGCLQGPREPDATGTSGSGARARARAAGPETVASDTGAATDRFTLVGASAEPGAAGVGANGAGGSGGPLVSGATTLQLDGVQPAARADVNKQVRVTGRLESRPATNATDRRLIVDSVQVVADTCASR